MRFIKYFKLFLERFTDNLNIKNWTISYNHSNNHDINDRILKRTSIKKENEFYEVLNDIIEKCNIQKLQGDYTFVSFKYSIKVICAIKNNSIYIITILGKDEKLKNDKIILI
jgi:hypothetical protein